MKVLHIVSRFYPDQGGSEKFVGGLIEGLRALGVSGSVVCFGDSPAQSVWRDVPVRRLRWSPVSSADIEQYTCFGDRDIAVEVGAVVDAERPELVHLHTRTREVAQELVCEVSRRGLPTVFTYHHPAATCLRGDLMRWNKDGCDGALHTRRCAACQMHQKGVFRLAAVTTASVPRASAAASALCTGRWRSALLIARRTGILHDQIRSFLGRLSHCIALCTWSRDLLVRNGVPADRVTVVRPGVVGERSARPPDPGTQEGRRGGAPRLVYLGRIDRVKGVHVVIEALRKTPLPMTLDIHGVMVDSGSQAYLHELRRIAAGDPRIRFAGPLASDRVVQELRTYDAIVVPSLLLETGPLVVYEAFSAGIPVIGSDIGAINEVVRDGIDGRLLPPGDVVRWRRGLREIGERPQDLARMREGILAPRAMGDVARETLRVYRNVQSGRSPDFGDREATRL
jgi:glycosyltransferase involved in cell wall biosynthesis